MMRRADLNETELPPTASQFARGSPALASQHTYFSTIVQTQQYQNFTGQVNNVQGAEVQCEAHLSLW